MDWKQELSSYTPQGEQECADKAALLEYIRCFPGSLLTRENIFAHITASGLILNRALSRVLFIYHNIYHSWGWTGGHADGDGDLLAVALREAREETGLLHVRPLSPRIAALDVLPVWGHVKRGRYVSAHQHLNVSYVLLADEGETLRHKPDENSGVGWFDVHTLATVSSEAEMIPVYEKIIRRAAQLAKEAPA